MATGAMGKPSRCPPPRGVTAPMETEVGPEALQDPSGAAAGAAGLEASRRRGPRGEHSRRTLGSRVPVASAA